MHMLSSRVYFYNLESFYDATTEESGQFLGIPTQHKVVQISGIIPSIR